MSRSGNKRVNAHTQEGRERVKTKSHDHKSEEDWSETSVGSMQFEELAPPTSAGDVSLIHFASSLPGHVHTHNDSANEYM